MVEDATANCGYNIERERTMWRYSGTMMGETAKGRPHGWISTQEADSAELNGDLGRRLEISMGEKLTQSGGLGANTEGEMAAEKKMANRGNGKHAHTDTRHLLNIRGIRFKQIPSTLLTVVDSNSSCFPSSVNTRVRTRSAGKEILITFLFQALPFASPSGGRAMLRGAVGFTHRQSFVLLRPRVRALPIPRRDVQNVPVIIAVVPSGGRDRLKLAQKTTDLEILLFSED
ncbi:hypothetical protein B0H13DRAFT_1878589 [Mycena leptocephala]|nr:hypothetical protein B0H13DRAFT_1878589 [Mycena leptocephala]